MTMTRAEVTDGYGREAAEFEALLRSLDDAQWTTPTRCAGWRVADVAAHVTRALAVSVAGQPDEFADPDHGDPLAFVLAATGRGDPGAVGLDETVNVYA